MNRVVLRKAVLVALVLSWLALLAPVTLAADPSPEVPLPLLARDFRAYYTGASMMLGGAGGQLYDLDAQFAWQKRFHPALGETSRLLPFAAPPLVAAAMAPLALLPFDLAYRVWSAVNVILLLWLSVLILRCLPWAGVLPGAAALLMVLTYLPGVLALIQGQLSYLIALGFLLAWRELMAGRDLRGGLWLALLLVKPQVLLLPALILLWKRRWRALVGLGALSLLLLALSWVLVGLEGFRAYPGVLQAVSGWNFASMVTWRGFLELLLGPEGSPVVTPVWLAGVVASCLLLAWGWRGQWRAGTAGFDLQWALLLIVSLFSSPYAFWHEGSLLLVAGALIARGFAPSSRGAPSGWLAWALPLAGYLAAIADWFWSSSSHWQLLVLWMACLILVLPSAPDRAAAAVAARSRGIRLAGH